MERVDISSGEGMTPLSLAKDEDGNVTVLPVFSGTVLSPDAAKQAAKWLIAKPKVTDESETDADGGES